MKRHLKKFLTKNESSYFPNPLLSVSQSRFYNFVEKWRKQPQSFGIKSFTAGKEIQGFIRRRFFTVEPEKFKN